MRVTMAQRRTLTLRVRSKFRARLEPKTRRCKRVVRGQPWESLFMRKSRAEKLVRPLQSVLNAHLPPY